MPEKESNIEEEGEILSSYYRKGTVEHQMQPPGGRDLSTYEKQLLFNRQELEGKKVLDLGAGPSLKFAKELERSGIKAEVVSLSPDFSEEKYRKKIPLSSEAEIVTAVGQALPFKNESFDRVFAFHVDEHLTRQQFIEIISEMARVIRKGGQAKLGPTLDIPDEWHPYDRILENKELMDELRNNGVEVIKEPIPETIMAKSKVKNSYDYAFYELSYNIVLRKGIET